MTRRRRSFANEQRESLARSRAAVTGCFAIIITVCIAGCGLLATWRAIGG